MPTRDGSIPGEVVRGFDADLFRLPEASGRLATSSVQSVWNVPVLLVAFSDQPFSMGLYGSGGPAQHFQRALFDTTGATATGSVFDYYRWVSGQRIRVLGRVVGTLTLPLPKNWYANNNWGLGFSPPRNIYGFVTSALQYADSSVDWQPFDQNQDGFVDMLWVVHSGFPGEATVAQDNLWSITSRLSSWPNGETFVTHTPLPGAPSVRMRIDRFSVLPELSTMRPGQPAEIGVYCHEFGHALGLPDLYDTGTLGGGTNAGPGNWSLMGTGGYGSDGLSPEYPAHLGAWPLLYLGWRGAVRPTRDTLMVHGPLAQGAPVVEFWFQGESNPEHFLIENRQRMGFDRNLPSEGLLVYQVDETIIAWGLPANRINAGPSPGLRLVEADGYYDIPAGRNRGDERDPFPGFFQVTEMDDFTSPSTRTFRGAVTNIALREIEPVGDDMRYVLQARAPGWGPAETATRGGFNPIWPSNGANRSLFLPDRSVVTVVSELRAGRPQVVLRARSGAGSWEDPFDLTDSPGWATDPCIAALPGGSDLVVAWSDTRHGAGELYYQSRIGGVWSGERRLTDLAGDSRYPSLGVDGSGRVHLAWLYIEAGRPQVRFMTFTYFSPFGTPRTVTQPNDLPDAPVVAVPADGLSHIFWSDRATGANSVWSARFIPGLGLLAKERLAPSTFAQPAVDATADAAGNVHVVWQVSGPGVNQIRYQRRPAGGGAPSPADTLVVSRGESVLSPVIRADAGLGLHLAFVALNGGIHQVRYKRRSPSHGWDAGATEITELSEGSAARPQMLPALGAEVGILYYASPGGTFDQLERRRYVPQGPVAAPHPVRTPASPALRLSPNPLQAGGALAFRLAAEARDSEPAVELFDLAGRRLAHVPLVRAGEEWFAVMPGDVTRGWRSGVYFARLRGARTTATRLVVLR